MNDPKKKLTLMLALLVVVVIVLVGCSSDDSNGADSELAAVQAELDAVKAELEAATVGTDSGSEEAAPEKSDQKYIMSVTISGHPFWTDIRKGAQDAADQLGVEFEFTGPVEWDALAQVDQVEQLINTKPAGFIIGSYDPSMTEAINHAMEAGIPVVTFDSDAPDSDRLTYTGPDHYVIGWEYGRYMADLLGGEGEVGVLTVLAQTNLQRRVQGIQDYFAENAPGVSVVAIEDNAGDDQITADKTKTIIQGNPEIDGIIVANATGSGVATALKELGKDGEIKVVTSDVSDPILAGIMDGAIDATSYVNIYLEGYYSLKFLYDYVNGKTAGVPGVDVGVNQLPPIVNPGLFFITADTAETFMTGD